MPPVSRFSRKPLVAVIASLAASTPGAAAAAAAARVDFAIGNVEVVSASGQREDLSRGDMLESGDTLSTGFGLAQIRFTDGAKMSVKPNSELKIEDYRFDGQDDANARTFLSLLKGGLRAVTGAIGKARRSNYRLRTAVATIGIRGTAYSVEYGNSIRVHVEGGSVEVLDRLTEEQVLMVLDQWQTGLVDDDGNAINLDGDLDLFVTLDETGNLDSVAVVDDEGNTINLDGHLDLFATLGLFVTLDEAGKLDSLDEAGNPDSVAVYSAGDEDSGAGPIVIPPEIEEVIAPVIDGGEGKFVDAQ